MLEPSKHHQKIALCRGGLGRFGEVRGGYLFFSIGIKHFADKTAHIALVWCPSIKLAPAPFLHPIGGGRDGGARNGLLLFEAANQLVTHRLFPVMFGGGPGGLR